MEHTPSDVLVCGPYRFTRNPRFLSELAIWLGALLRRRGLCWMSDRLGVRDENGDLREKIFSKIVSACFSSQSWASFMIQMRHYIEAMTMSPVQLNQSGSPPTGECLWLQMRETGQLN
jgi:hypothetical protein